MVRTLQKALETEGYYRENIDVKFGRWTYDAVKAFQTAKFDQYSDDGIVGEKTAEKLNMDWPML